MGLVYGREMRVLWGVAASALLEVASGGGAVISALSAPLSVIVVCHVDAGRQSVCPCGGVEKVKVESRLIFEHARKCTPRRVNIEI